MKLANSVLIILMMICAGSCQAGNWQYISKSNDPPGMLYINVDSIKTVTADLIGVWQKVEYPSPTTILSGGKPVVVVYAYTYITKDKQICMSDYKFNFSDGTSYVSSEPSCKFNKILPESAAESEWNLLFVDLLTGTQATNELEFLTHFRAAGFSGKLYADPKSKQLIDKDTIELKMILRLDAPTTFDLVNGQPRGVVAHEYVSWYQRNGTACAIAIHVTLTDGSTLPVQVGMCEFKPVLPTSQHEIGYRYLYTPATPRQVKPMETNVL